MPFAPLAGRGVAVRAANALSVPVGRSGHEASSVSHASQRFADAIDVAVTPRADADRRFWRRGIYLLHVGPQP